MLEREVHVRTVYGYQALISDFLMDVETKISWGMATLSVAHLTHNITLR